MSAKWRLVNMRGKLERFARRSASSGFTLIELMVTISIAAIVLMMAVPSFSAAMLSNRLTGFANTFVASAQLARSEAIKRNAAVTLCRSANGTTCATSGGWEQGWVILAGTSLIQTQAALTSGYKLSGGSGSLSFPASGVGFTAITLTLCRATPQAGSQERVININATGRTSVTKTTAGVCA